MFYAALAIIVAGIAAALAPLVREWAAQRKRNEEAQTRLVAKADNASDNASLTYGHRAQNASTREETSMERVDLNVPFSEKDQAKSLGAKWDPQRKVWYVPPHADSSPFRKWYQSHIDINVRSSGFCIVESSTLCWKCGEPTAVYSFMLAAGHEVYEPIEDDDDGPPGIWQIMDMATIVHYVEYIPASVAKRIALVTASYRIDFSKTTHSSYWMNHCEHCGMKQGDFMMHCEPDGAFMPMSSKAASELRLHSVNELFEARASVGYSPDIFDHLAVR